MGVSVMTYALEIGMIRGWDRVKALMKYVVIVQLAHILLIRSNDAVTRPPCPPGLVERAGVVGREGDIEGFALICDSEALHHVQPGRVGRAVAVHEGPVAQTDRVHDERIATLIMAHGFAVPGWRGVL